VAAGPEKRSVITFSHGSRRTLVSTRQRGKGWVTIDFQGLLPGFTSAAHNVHGCAFCALFGTFNYQRALGGRRPTRCYVSRRAGAERHWGQADSLIPEQNMALTICETAVIRHCAVITVCRTCASGPGEGGRCPGQRIPCFGSDPEEKLWRWRCRPVGPRRIDSMRR